MLDPFCGTGTTMLAALNAGRNCVGMDIDPEYCRWPCAASTPNPARYSPKPAIEYHTAADLLAPPLGPRRRRRAETQTGKETPYPSRPCR